MRKFKIQGLNTGAEFDLNNFTYLLYAPANLGLKFKTEFLKVFNTRFEISNEYDFQDFNCMLMIKGYSEYETFRNFIAKNIESGFRLWYSPTIGIDRYIVCSVSELDKTELTFDGTLRCKFVLTPKSYWQVGSTSSSEFVEGEILGKAYLEDTEESGLFGFNYGYKEDPSEVVDLFKHNYIYAGASTNEAFLINNADFKTALKITLSGPAIKPYLQLIDVNGNIVQDALFDLTILEGEKLVINSDPANLAIDLININGQATDKTDSQDYSRTTYLTLPVGEFTLRISEENGRNVIGVIEYNLNFMGA